MATETGFKWVIDDDGVCLARDNLRLSFFAKRPFSEVVEAAAYCFERYLQIVPEDALKWALIGGTADTHQPLDAKALARCRSLLTVPVAKQKKVHFRVMGPQKWGPDCAFLVTGHQNPETEDHIDETNVVEMIFPREYLASCGEDKFAVAALHLFDQGPWDSGYAAIALRAGPPSREWKARGQMVPVALKSHGYDIADTMMLANTLGRRCRSAAWLTMLSDDLVRKLGGRDALAAKLDPDVSITPARAGLMLRAGDEPEIGDANRNLKTPLLASVAHAIEGVTLFHDVGTQPYFEHQPERRDRWERRFWWQ
jgi:TseV toxin immunity protein TsiV